MIDAKRGHVGGEQLLPLWTWLLEGYLPVAHIVAEDRRTRLSHLARTRMIVKFGLLAGSSRTLKPRNPPLALRSFTNVVTSTTKFWWPDIRCDQLIAAEISQLRGSIGGMGVDLDRTRAFKNQERQPESGRVGSAH